MGQVKQIEVFPDFRDVRVAEPDRLLRQIADLQKMPQPFRDVREVDAVQNISWLFPVPTQVLSLNLQIA